MFPIVSREKAVSLPALRDLINQHFPAEELRQLYFGLSIEYENLPGGTRLAKAQPLAQYSPRHSRLPDLCQHYRQLRLKVNWLVFTRGTSKPTTSSPAYSQSGATWIAQPQDSRVVRKLKEAADILNESTKTTDAVRKAGTALIELAGGPPPYTRLPQNCLAVEKGWFNP